MRSLILVLGPLALMSVCSAGVARADDNYPWCAFYFDGAGASNCGFDSEAQCRLSVQGTGGTCIRNSHYVAPPPAPPGALPPPAPAPARPRR